MSIRAVAYIKGLTACPNGEHISRSEKLVGLILGDSHQDRAHRRTFPSVDGMAEDAGFSERQFMRLLASLEHKGVIRREYPDGHGRGKTTFYFFPELDDKSAVKQPADVSIETGKGCQNVTLSGVNDSLEKVTFSGQKGDRRVTSDAPHLNNKNNNNNEDKDTPQPPASGGGGKDEVHPVIVNDIADEVMHGCGVSNRRRRPAVVKAVKLAILLGELPQTLAKRMVEAWKEQAEMNNRGLLRIVYGFEGFFADGKWNHSETWHWNHEKLDRQRDARVGVW